MPIGFHGLTSLVKEATDGYSVGNLKVKLFKT